MLYPFSFWISISFKSVDVFFSLLNQIFNIQNKKSHFEFPRTFSCCCRIPKSEDECEQDGHQLPQPGLALLQPNYYFRLLLVHLYKSGFNHHIYHYQLFIDGLFCDATSGKKLRSIDPRNEELICEVTFFQSLSFEQFCHFLQICILYFDDLKVESASSEDVDRACKAAQRAFEGKFQPALL